MRLALAFAAVAALVAAVPSSPRACEAPGPCPLVDVCDTTDCDAPADPAPAAPPSKRCDAPDCDSAAKAACDAPGCGAPDVTRAGPPPDPQD